MRNILFILSSALVAANLFACDPSQPEIPDESPRKGRAAQDLLEDVRQKIEKTEKEKQDYINTKIAPDNVFGRTAFNDLATQESIEINGVKYKLAAGLTQEKFKNELMPNPNMIISNTLKGLKREDVERHKKSFSIKYSYEASMLDRKGGRYEFSVETDIPNLFRQLELKLENLKQRQQKITESPTLEINLDMSHFSQNEHKSIIDHLESCKNTFACGSLLLSTLFNMKENCEYANKVYLTFATHLFQYRDLINDGTIKLSTLVDTKTAPTKLDEEFSVFKRNTEKHYDVNIQKFFIWGIAKIANRAPKEVQYAAFFEDALDA